MPLKLPLRSLLIVVLLLASCDAFDPQRTKRENNERSLQARDFYKPFFYDVYSKEKALVSDLANAVETGSDADSPPRLNGDRYPGVNLFLLVDGSYYFEYLEGRAGGYGGVTALDSVLFSGKWDISDGRVALGDQATLELNPEAGAGLEITFSANVISAGLAKKPFNLQAQSLADQGDDLFDAVLKKHGQRPVPPPVP